MKFIDIYFNYKQKYEDYIIIYLVGNFYQILGEDTKIMNEIFHYKVLVDSNGISKVGFPLNSLEKVKKRLKYENINFIIVEKEDGIVKIKKKQKFNNNQYHCYNQRAIENHKRTKQIEIITNKLYSLNNEKYDELMKEIEKIL